MVLTDALIQIKNVDRFRAKVNVDVGELDPTNPPTTFRGVFGELDLKAQMLIYEKRTENGSSHTVWLFGNRTGYQFTMDSHDSLWFTAKKI